jgi:dCMP deaminase
MEDKSPRISWYQYSLKLAKVASERSEDPFMKVGACVLRSDNSVAGIGYNGAPPGISINWIERDMRRLRVIHAEVNALRYVTPGECYLLACTHLPCNDCLKTISAYGINEVVYNEVYPRDVSSLDIAGDLGVKLVSTEKGLSGVGKEYRQKVELIDGI